MAVSVGEQAMLGAVLKRNDAPRVPGEHFLVVSRDDLNSRILDDLRLLLGDEVMLERQAAEVALGGLIGHHQVVAVLKNPEIVLIDRL